MTQEVGCEVTCIEDSKVTPNDIQALQNNVLNDVLPQTSQQTSMMVTSNIEDMQAYSNVEKKKDDKLNKLLDELENLL